MRLYLVLSLLVIFSAPANAYIDAGSGSYMLQMALAGIMALVFSVKLSWQRLRTRASGILASRSGTSSGE